MTNVNISYSSVSNGETTLKNEDSINVRSYILFFSFRRFFFIFSLTLFRISSTSRSRIFHTRILTRLRFLLFIFFFFLLLISPFLSHTRTLSPSVSYLTQLMQNVPTQSDECVCVYVFPVILFNQSSRSHFARRFPHFFPPFLHKILDCIFFFEILARVDTFTHTGKVVW